MQLDDELKRELIDRIEKNERIPETFKNLLFSPKEEPKEIELKYGIKEREEDILADTMAMPFQPAMRFGKIPDSSWHNMLIFGDNLQALKYFKKLQEGKKLEKIKLIFIDPPFGTGDIYDAKGAPAYSAALQGAEFVEFLRKRLIFLRELLADDGSIYLRIDYHFGHYIKVVMDEIFGKNNFQNEIVVNRIKKSDTRANKFNTATDSLFFYSKTSNFIFKGFRKILDIRKEERWHAMDSQGPGPSRVFFGKKLTPPPQRHWTFTQENIDAMIKEGRIRLKCRKCGYIHDKGDWTRCPECKSDDPRPEYKLEPTDSQLLDSNWTDIPGYTFQWNYPTENSEQLLERVILASSNPGDLVLDCFAGSGTTGAVAEKLNRRWVMVDSSKLAIYTIIKRMHNLRKEIGNKGNQLKPKPFALYNAGLYEDHDFILRMGEENFKRFAIDLFQAESKNFDINGLKMDGVLLNCPVKVFSQEGYLTEEYIDQLHSTVGEYIKARMFIIAPASRVFFLQDYIEKDGVRYYVLRIPYSVIDELHKKTFTRPLQPSSLKEINQNIEQVGFDFIHPPNVQAEYYIRKPKDKLVEEELVVEIKEFEAVQRAKDPMNFENPKDALSMMLVDKDYNGEYFNMTDYLFADQIKKENYKARLSASGVGEKIAIIYLDIFGNERIEVKGIREFKRE